eukprot:359634-Chlamydomonas_euryale.AAC.1
MDGRTDGRMDGQVDGEEGAGKRRYSPFLLCPDVWQRHPDESPGPPRLPAPAVPRASHTAPHRSKRDQTSLNPEH